MWKWARWRRVTVDQVWKHPVPAIVPLFTDYVTWLNLWHSRLWSDTPEVRCEGLRSVWHSIDQALLDSGRHGTQLRSCPPQRAAPYAPPLPHCAERHAVLSQPALPVKVRQQYLGHPVIAHQHSRQPRAVGWMVQRGKGGGSGKVRAGGHERNHLPRCPRQERMSEHQSVHISMTQELRPVPDHRRSMP